MQPNLLQHTSLEFPPKWAAAWGEDSYGLYADLQIDHEREIVQRFRWIAAGEFIMGSPDNEPARDDDERQHVVTLSDGYWLANTTVTQECWEALMGNNPARFKDKNNPVEQVSWDDVQKLIKQVQKNVGTNLADLVARLPSEAEWEHACRAGTESPFSFGKNITSEQVNYNGNHPYSKGEKGSCRKKTISIKSLPSNQWGLYEMHGNVREWCADAWQADLGGDDVLNPYTKGTSSALRVLRGGSWADYGRDVRSASRDHRSPDIRDSSTGFRLLLGHELQSR